MMNGQPQMPTYDGNLKVPVELPLLTWQNILNIVAEAPWKTADPILVEVRKQLTAFLETAPQVSPPGTELRQ